MKFERRGGSAAGLSWAFGPFSPRAQAPTDNNATNHSTRNRAPAPIMPRGGNDAVSSMKALILYVMFVAIGGLISVGIGYYVEKEFSSTASLIVFLALFFSNFAVSWIAVILVMDGSLKNARGAQEQLEIEKAGRAGIAAREANAVAAREAKRA